MNELEQYETVWKGDTWREFTPDPVVTDVHRYPPRVGRTGRGWESFGRITNAVLDAIEPEWRRCLDIAESLEVDSRAAYYSLRVLVRRGYIEKQTVGGVVYVRRAR